MGHLAGPLPQIDFNRGFDMVHEALPAAMISPFSKADVGNIENRKLLMLNRRFTNKFQNILISIGFNAEGKENSR